MAFLLPLVALACGAHEHTIAAPEPHLDPVPPTVVGEDRPARVVLPDDYTIDKEYPLVFLLHGFSANPGLQDMLFQMERRVTDHQFILVLPAGTRNDDGLRFWNATPECCDFDGSEVDDVGYLTGLIDEATSLYAVDPERIGFLGHSNGGYMSYRMACEIPDVVTRVAVLAGSVYLEETDCTGTAPVSVLHMHGTADDVVPYHNNLGEDIGEVLRVHTVGAEEAVQRWGDKAGCDQGMPAPQPADLHTGLSGEETDIFQWTGCATGIDIELWRINDGDHLLLAVNDDFRDRIADFLVR